MKKRNAYLELLALLGVLFAVGYLIHGDDWFWGKASPSPYWIIIILISLRYGNPPGVISGVACAAFQIMAFCNFSFSVLRENIFLEPAVLLTPGIFIAAGLFIGEAVHSAVKRGDFLAGKLEKCRERVDNLERDRNEIEKSYRQIEGKVAGESNTLYHLLSSLNLYGECEQSELPAIISTLCQRFIHARDCDYWMKNKAEEWVCIYPQAADQHKMPKIGEIALAEKRVVTSRDYVAHAGEDDCDMAGIIKIKTPGSNIISEHLVTVNRIKFSKWHSRLETIFSFLLHEAEIVHNRIELEKALDYKMPFEKELRLEGVSFVRSHVQKALLAQERSGGVSSVFFLSIVSDAHKNDIRIYAVIASALRCLLRVSDVAVFLPEVNTFAAFLPDTDVEGAKIAYDKLMQRVNELDLDAGQEKLRCNVDYHELSERGQFDEILHKLHKTLLEFSDA